MTVLYVYEKNLKTHLQGSYMNKLSSSLIRLIKILNDGKFHSGTDLGAKLNISRNAIWKHLNRLSELGIQIESTSSQGYHLQHPLVFLDAKNIRKNFKYQGNLKLGKIDIFSNIKSTMDFLKIDKISDLNIIDICLAETQTEGRGRFGRNWHSPFASNIYFSCRWTLNKDVTQLAGLSLVIGLALIDTLIELEIDKDLAIKWPNDICWQEKKLAGILLEINATGHSITQIIIGIGINVNMPSPAEKIINRPWAAINQIMKADQDRNKIIGVMLSHLLKNLSRFADDGLTPFLPEWTKYDLLYDRNIVLENGQQKISGIAKGIDQFGQLILQQTDGKFHTYSAGETTIKHYINATARKNELLDNIKKTSK